MMLDDAVSNSDVDAERRSFLIRIAAAACGAIVAFFPFAVGLGVLIDPWRRGRRDAKNSDDTSAAEFIRICSLDALPADGTPQAFPVVTKLIDAWTHAPNQRVGMVFLHRTGDEKSPQVVAFSAECPHLGCFVDFNTTDGHYECPCHESAFDKDGRKLFGPSLRGLDRLEVKLEKNGDQTNVLVAFQKFQKGIAKQEATG
jgi:nitrite reductase/ring-hydroxylating ferredoxin subunit